MKCLKCGWPRIPIIAMSGEMFRWICVNPRCGHEEKVKDGEKR